MLLNKPVMLRPRCHTGFEAIILASASTSWPRPALGLVNLASKMCYPMQYNIDCVTATFFTKTVKHSKVGQKFSYVLLALSLCVLIQKYLHVASLHLGLGLDVLASFNITGINWS